MSAGTYDLAIEAGATYTRVFTWKTGDPLAAVNLTGYTAHAQLRGGIDDDPVVLNLTNGSGITLGGSAGTITLTITAAQTAALDLDRGVWDLKLTDASGTVTRLLQGGVTVSQEVTV